MDVKGFADELLYALADTELFERVALQTEGPIVSGQADENHRLHGLHRLKRRGSID